MFQWLMLTCKVRVTKPTATVFPGSISFVLHNVGALNCSSSVGITCAQLSPLNFLVL